MSKIPLDEFLNVYPIDGWMMKMYKTSQIINIVASCYDMVAVTILQKINSVGILKLLKLFPCIRKIFKKHAKLLPLKFSYREIRNKDLKYLKNVHTIDLSCCNNITDSGVKHLKKVKSIDLACCNKLINGIKYLKNCDYVNISSCTKITNIYHLKKCKKIDISRSGLTLNSLSHIDNLQEIVINGTDYIYKNLTVLTGLKNLKSVSVTGRLSSFVDLDRVKQIYGFTFDLIDCT